MIDPDASVLLESDDLRVQLLPLGATLCRFEVRLADGSWRNIMLGAPDVDAYRGPNRYIGATVGRVANRIAGARFLLDGTEYRLDANEGPNTLHSGDDGYDARDWTIDGRGPDWVEFALTSPDGDGGFPGALRLTARYELVPGGAQVTYRGTTDAPTVVNVTTHPYVNVAGEASGTTDDQVLVVHASRFTPTDADGLPTGEVRDVAGTAVDFRAGRRLGDVRDGVQAEGIARNEGLDHNFVVDGTGLREHCRLTGADGVTLTVVSDQPALQVYGGEHFDGTQVGTSGVPYVRRAGLALEAQGFPDAPNHPRFPSIVLRPGEEYRHTTRWLVSLASS